MHREFTVIDTVISLLSLSHWLSESVRTSFNRRHNTHHTFKADHPAPSAFLSSKTLPYESNPPYKKSPPHGLGTALSNAIFTNSFSPTPFHHAPFVSPPSLA
jgi:hypothetical protein